MDDFAQGRNKTALPPNVAVFNWETKVKDILPGEWELLDHWATEKANIRDILSHVSGLPRFARCSNFPALRPNAFVGMTSLTVLRMIP